MDLKLNISRFLVILFVVFFTNCEIKKGVITFEILNNKLYYAPIFEKPKNDSKREYINSIYNRYLNKSDWDKSLNIIKLKFTNHTENKIVIFKKQYLKERIYDNEFDKNSLSNFYFQIKDSNNQDLKFISAVFDNFSSKITEDFKRQIKKDSLKQIMASKKGYKSLYDMERLDDFMIIEPGQSFNFEIMLSLPIPIDYDNILDNSFGIPMCKENSYKIQVVYVLNKEDVFSNLPPTILQMLKDQGVVMEDVHLKSELIEVEAK